MSLAARVGRAIFWSQAGRLAESALWLLFSLFLARILGPSSYGLFALGMSLAGISVFLSLLGLGPETLGRFLPELATGGHRDGARNLLGKLLVVRVAAIVFVSLCIFASRHTLAVQLRFPAILTSLFVVLLIFATRSIFDLLTYFSSALLDLRRVAAAKLTASLAAPGIFLVFLAIHRGNVVAAWLSIAGSSAAGILVLAIPPAGTGTGGPPSLPIPFRRILQFGLFTWATNFFLYVLGDNTDVLLLGWLVRDPAAVGCYAIGAKIAFSLTGLLLGWAPLMSVAAFSEARLHGGIPQLAKVMEMQWKFAVLCLVGPLLLLARYAREIVGILYLPVYGRSVPVIQILCGLMACGVVCGFSLPAGVLYALNHERLACALVGAAALFNLVSEVVLVRRLGINGAAWATGLSFILLASLCSVAAAQYVPWRFPLQFIGKVIAAAFLGLVSTLWSRPISVPTLAADCALYATAFFVSLAVLKPLSGTDSASLRRVNRFLGRWAEKIFADVRTQVGER